MDLVSRCDSQLWPLVIISPHYDDAVFSCGNLMASVASSTVITVCTGLPDNIHTCTDWDRRCGFSGAEHAMRERDLENREALALLQANAIDLGFLDDQYCHHPDRGTDLLGDILTTTLSSLHPATVLFPLGLFHSDHIRISDVLLGCRPRLPAVRWLLYADIPYCRNAQLVRCRMNELAGRQIQMVPLIPDGMAARQKTEAVTRYRSQLRGLGYDSAEPVLQQPEKYWHLHASADLL